MRCTALCVTHYTIILYYTAAGTYVLLYYNNNIIFTRLRMSIQRRSSETRRLRDSVRLDRSPRSRSPPGARHGTLKHSHDLNERELVAYMYI